MVIALNAKGVQVDEFAGPLKVSTKLLDFKNQLDRLFNLKGRNNLFVIDNVVYNENEAGNYVWAFILTIQGIVGSPEDWANAQGYKSDEWWDNKAIRSGIRAANKFRMSSRDYKQALEIRLTFRYDYNEFQLSNSTGNYRPGGFLASYKKF